MSVMNTLSDLRRRIAGPRVEAGTRRAQVVAVSARKGGVGKTTTAVNLGAGLAAFHGRKVLLLDMDAQGHVEMSIRTEARGYGAEPLGRILLEKRRDVFEIVQPTSVDGLWYVPSDTGLADTESQMSSRIGKELLLRSALKIARTHFDVVLIDCPPNLGSLTVNALVAADLVLVPCNLDTLGLDGVESLLETIEVVQETLNPAIGILGLVRTRVDRRNQKMNAAIEDTLRSRYGAYLLESEIGVSTALGKAQHAGRPVFMHDDKSRGSSAYRALAAEIDRRLHPR